MTDDSHTITSTAHLQVTRPDLELARHGLPSRSVSAADIAAVCTPGPRTSGPGDPGYRLIAAEIDSPEGHAQTDAWERDCETEARDQAAWTPAQAEHEAEAGR